MLVDLANKSFRQWSNTDVKSYFLHIFMPSKCVDEKLFGLEIFNGLDGNLMSQMTINDFVRLSNEYGTLVFEEVVKLNQDTTNILEINRHTLSQSVIFKFVNSRSNTILLRNLDSIPYPRMANPEGDEAASFDQQQSESNQPQRERPLIWKFCRDLLRDPNNSAIISWINTRELIFKIQNTEEVAKLWGIVKRNSSMNYDTFSRAIRFSRGRNFFKKPVLSRNERRYIFQFGENALKNCPFLRRVKYS